MEAPCHRSRAAANARTKNGADKKRFLLKRVGVRPQRPRSFEFVATFLAGQRGGNLPRSEADSHKSEADGIFRFLPGPEIIAFDAAEQQLAG